jgi:2,4-dienoyl-CoA reductase-like NADH-dependent reductase (Old Yellow Enzyme family)
VLDAVRAGWAGPLAVRLSVTDWHPRGNTVEDGIALARELAAHGCDLIHVEAGQTVHDDRPEYRRGYLTALSDRVRNEARVPTLVGGYLTTLDEANTIVGAGRADLVLLDLPDTQIERILESSDAVRAVWAGPLAVRLSVTDWHPRGNTVEDGIAIARELAAHGCDLIQVEAGQTVHDDRPEYRRGFLTALSDRVRNEARVPTIVGGYLTTLDEANTIVGAGRADLVLLDLPQTEIERPIRSSNTVLRGEVRV